MHGTPTRHGLARALSKRGLCSRTVAARWIAEGRVRVDGLRIRDPEFPTTEHSRIEVLDPDLEGAISAPLQAGPRRVLLLNKPRGLLTTRSDERGRATVYDCFTDAQLPWLAPVGRLDQASEGALLFTNDPQWAARLLDPQSHISKTYHVQIDRIADAALLEQLLAGVDCAGESLHAAAARILRQGARNSWLELVLTEGRNRQIRRMLQSKGIAVQRLIRVAIGALPLGQLGKGQWRWLDDQDLAALEAV
jgi:23S rRNA pseudouridine2605 synthase